MPTTKHPSNPNARDRGALKRSSGLARIWLLLALVLLLLGLLTMLYSRTKQEPSGSKAPVTKVTVAQSAKTLLFLPLYIAAESDLLAEEKIEVEILTSGGDAQVFAALASGQAQFAQGDPAFVAISHERNGPGIVVASVLDRVAFWGVSFDPELAVFSDPSGFKGLSVVTYPEPNTAYVVQTRLVERAGLELGKDSKIVQATFGSELGPLEAGVAQIAATIEPNVSTAEATGAQVVFSYADAWGPFLLTGLMTTSEFANSNEATVETLVAAYEEALQTIRTNPERAIAVAQENFPEVSAEVLSNAITRMTREDVFPEHAAVNFASWRAALQLRVAVGDLKSADHDALVRNEFALRSSSGAGSP